jgi:hypothetical protein
MKLFSRRVLLRIGLVAIPVAVVALLNFNHSQPQHRKAAPNVVVFSVVPGGAMPQIGVSDGAPLVRVDSSGTGDSPVDTSTIIDGEHPFVPETGGVVMGPDGTFPDGLFALGTSSIGLRIAGSNNQIAADAHISSSIVVGGASHKVSGSLEYAGTLTKSGVGHLVDGTQTPLLLSASIQDVTSGILSTPERYTRKFSLTFHQPAKTVWLR